MTTTAVRATYHHGRLREALIEAGLALTRTGGPSALGLRDVCRQVGVSANAAYRHFADRGALLAAVTERLQDQVAGQMDDLAGPGIDPRQALRAVGLGYVDFALQEPGWFEVAFGETDADPGGTGSLPAPLARLTQALDGLVEAGQLDPAARTGAEWPCWAAVHGFALLALHGPLRQQPYAVVRTAAERTVDTVIAGLLVGR